MTRRERTCSRCGCGAGPRSEPMDTVELSSVVADDGRGATFEQCSGLARADRSGRRRNGRAELPHVQTTATTTTTRQTQVTR